MSTQRRIVFATSVTWLSRLVTILLSLILLPVLFRHIGQEELGLWFLLGQSGAFLALLDLGISPTITRRIAFVKGKSKSNSPDNVEEEVQKEIAELVATGRVIYRVLTILVFVVAWTAGLFFLKNIEVHQVSEQVLWTAWTVMCLSHALVVWAALWACLLQGTGHVGWDGLISIAVQVCVLLLQILAVLIGGGLLSLAAVAAAGAVISRIAMLSFIRKRRPELVALKGKPSWNLFKSLVRPALKCWLTGLGAFLIIKTDQYFIAYYRGVADLPGYQASYQLVSNLMLLAMAPAFAGQVFISQLWQAGNILEVHRMAIRSFRFALLIMGVGTACMLSVGEYVIDIWLGPGNFIGYPVLTVFCALLFLETQHSVIATASRATEDEAYVIFSLSAGVLNLIFSWYLIRHFGLLGVALGTLLAQVLTNNWYAVYRGLWRLKISFAKYLQQVLMPIALIFMIYVLALQWMKYLALQYVSANWVMVICLAATLIATSVLLWLFVLHAAERERLLKYVLGKL